jgi:hypothetical protein
VADLHRAIGLAVLALAAVAAGWSVALSVRSGAGGRPYLATLAIVVAGALAAALLGLVLLAGGPGPGDPLHLVYGVVAVGALPIAAVAASGRRPRTQSLVLLAAALVEVGVLVRLVQTG